MEYISQKVAICSIWTVCPCFSKEPFPKNASVGIRVFFITKDCMRESILSHSTQKFNPKIIPMGRTKR